MGMNYYLITPPCPMCSHCAVQKHIGKSSFGWQFHFRGYPFEGIESLKDWLREFQDKNKKIIDEERREVSIEEFQAMVESKKNGLSFFNIVKKEPKTEEEKKYIRDRESRNYFNHISINVWKDSEGHSFEDAEFA